MNVQALRRLEHAFEKFKSYHDKSLERQTRLSEALGKSRDEMERLRAELQRYRAERIETRKRVDTLLRRFEGLGLDSD